MKDTFYVIFKALFVLKILTFLSWLSGHVEKMAGFERLQTGQRAIKIWTLPNI